MLHDKEKKNTTLGKKNNTRKTLYNLSNIQSSSNVCPKRFQICSTKSA